ncbi:MAG: hypothetical protein AAF533_24225 [Acidobacteriota bacterium]
MGYCKHDWQHVSDALRVVFGGDADRRQHDFYVCRNCLKIEEVAAQVENAA